jgi:hypothetical protein
MRTEFMEQRQDQRLRVEPGALLAGNPFSGEIWGEIVNVSKGGLAFFYRFEKKPVIGRLDVVWPGGGTTLLADVSFEAVSDLELVRRSLWPGPRMWLRGVRFGYLTREQSTRLAECLARHTVIEANPGDEGPGAKHPRIVTNSRHLRRER